MTDIKYKLNIVIANQRDEQNICANCKKNEEKSGEEEYSFMSKFPIKKDEDLQILEEFLKDEQNRIKLVRYLFYKQFIILNSRF